MYRKRGLISTSFPSSEPGLKAKEFHELRLGKIKGRGPMHGQIDNGLALSPFLLAHEINLGPEVFL